MISYFNRKAAIPVLLLLAVLLVSASCGGRDHDSVVLTAPFGPLVYPFLRMEAVDGPVDYEVVVWNDPDQLKALIAGGQADFFGLPSNVAAIFHNKGAGLSLAAVSVWKVLWIVTSDSTKTSLADFKGESIVMPFRGDMPHIVFEEVARERGFDPEHDFDLRFVTTPQDASRLLLTGGADHALLAEPDLSMLLKKAASGEAGEGRLFYRAIDLQDEWAALKGGGNELPIGAVAVTEGTQAKTAVTPAFCRDYEAALEWCSAHPAETAAMVAARFPGVEAAGVEDAMHHVVMRYETASEARKSLETFFSAILAANPARIGGKLPGDSFYLKP